MRTPVLDVFRPAVHALCRTWFGLRIEGAGHVPVSGPVVITPNHQTYADPTLVTIAVRRRIYYMAWDRLFEVPGLAWLIRRLRAFPVQIESRDPRATREAVRILRAGHAVMIFPEGSRSLDGSLGPFKPGAFRLAASAGVPVLPVTIAGGHEVWPPGRVLPRSGQITLTYHPPVWPDVSLGTRESAVRLAAEVRSAIASVLGPTGDPARSGPAVPPSPDDGPLDAARARRGEGR